MKKLLPIVFTCLSLAFTAPPVLASERAEQGWQWIEQGAMIVDVRTHRKSLPMVTWTKRLTSRFQSEINTLLMSIKIRKSCFIAAVVIAQGKRINIYNRKDLPTFITRVA